MYIHLCYLQNGNVIKAEEFSRLYGGGSNFESEIQVKGQPFTCSLTSAQGGGGGSIPSFPKIERFRPLSQW